ncbi:MAG: imidazole glycerol phosphate synthase subunit HisH [Ruminococcaceae bacterium]|nr:imidazole glycerol phosphate synthase subunit HisH [Oscillospiraceae bacterium]
MIAIVDYGVGNLFSLKSSFEYIGEDVCVTGDIRKIKDCEKILLPGVGAFEDAARKLRESGLYDTVIREAEKGKYVFGICLGMQMLLDRSFEYGEHKGLGLISGEVRPINEDVPEGFKIPHIGWNSLIFPKGKEKHPIFKYVNEGDCVYFVHSYHAKNCEESVIASAEYGGILTAAVAKDNVMGTQFHPEKSGRIGLDILKAFCEL